MSFTAPVAGLPRIGTRMAPKVEELRKPRVHGEQSIYRWEYRNMDKTAAYNLGLELALRVYGLTKLGRARMIRAIAKARGARGAAKRVARGAPQRTGRRAPTPTPTAPIQLHPLTAAAGIGGVGLLGYGMGAMGSQPGQPVYSSQLAPAPFPTPYPHL